MNKTSAQFDASTPVLLSTSVNVAENNSGIPSSRDLSYPYRKAIWLEEIRFDVSFPSGSATVDLGALVYAKLYLGKHYLMRDPMPIWLLGTVMGSYSLEALKDTTLSTTVTYGHFRWRLPEPLYIEAGQYLSTVLNRFVDGLGGNVTVQVSYVGRTVPPSQPRPKVFPVPYAAPFLTTVNGSTYQQSNEKHLFNPFNAPLRVQRMTGRVLTFVSGLIASNTLAMTPSVNNPSGTTIAVQIYDSWGGKIVNDLTGPSDVWDVLRASWTFDTILPPKGMYQVQAWNIDVGKALHVGMIGVREEML